MSLQEYAKKRDFQKTAEPDASLAPPKKGSHRFVIQKHAASRLHYDFRLEMNGTLKSWAVPKGLPYAKGEKHLAVHVEDHPVAYIDFEGTIPKGQYGGGTVMVWDQGTFESILTENPEKELAGGKLHFILTGQKLKGEWYLVRLRDGDEWLMIKGGEDMKPLSRKLDDTSVLSGKNMKELSQGDRVWQSKETSTAHVPAKKKAARAAKAAPLPKFVEPMKARLATSAPHGEWAYEIKFDGWRALALKGGSQTRLLSRNEKDIGAKFPEIMESVAALGAQDAVIDGEIVALDEKGRSSFQLLQAYDIGEERPQIFYYVFDLLQLNGHDLRGFPLSKRKAELEKLMVDPSGVIRFSATLGTDATPLLEQARKLGLEGLIGKKADSLYESGHRSGAWIKLKLVREQEFIIGGYTEPSGTRKHFGALLVGFHKNGKLTYASKVGTGFSTKLLGSLHKTFQKIASLDCPFVNLPEKRASKWGQTITASEMTRCHWIEPVMVCQIKFSEWTRDEHLRQPVFIGLRDDKNASEVIREKAD